ncbi:MAG TPA: hypothetical protein DCL15_00510, partial [Chloroflexi bacterium]|nr:hypothetical protein [Chloroflexota bacterium]
ADGAASFGRRSHVVSQVIGQAIGQQPVSQSACGVAREAHFTMRNIPTFQTESENSFILPLDKHSFVFYNVGRNGVMWGIMWPIALFLAEKWGSDATSANLGYASCLLFGVFLCNEWCVVRTYLPHQV